MQSSFLVEATSSSFDHGSQVGDFDEMDVHIVPDQGLDGDGGWEMGRQSSLDEFNELVELVAAKGFVEGSDQVAVVQVVREIFDHFL